MIQYKDKNYPTRTFRVLRNDGSEYEYEYQIATESLSDALALDEDREGMSLEDKEHFIDNQIYFYVPDKVLLLDAHLICEKHLDEPMEFISEVF